MSSYDKLPRLLRLKIYYEIFKRNDMDLITNRLQHFRELRADVVKLKKEERGNKLHSINKTISTLKRWVKELKDDKR